MSPNAGDLSGAVGLVTGGVSGIGAAITAELRGRGAIVVAVDRNAKPGAAPSSSEIGPARSGWEAAADVRDFATLSGLSGQVRGEFGRLDFVVANAGITDWGSMSDGDPQRWRDVIETNVLGVAQTIRATMPVLVAQGRGHIVITASISGRTAYVGEPIYIATKWALVGLSKALRKEARPAGVRVSVIEPGIVDTPLVRQTAEGAAELAAVRALEPQDVARMVTFVLEQPAHVNVDEIMVSPLGQDF
ncbi:MAG TPA: SDR family oxidoreductase [Streptosporangiaceae bacterium]|jgi:NADP-dependent 3-hydroxy acid dehydrogenase YdfG